MAPSNEDEWVKGDIVRASIDNAANPRPGLLSRLFMSLFLLPFGLGGLFFAYYLGSDLLQTAATYRWDSSSCEVIENRIMETNDSDSRFEPLIRYQYNVGGQRLVSAKVSTKPWRHSDSGAATRFADGYRIGTRVPCFVNPSNPADAILVRKSLGEGFLLIVPAIFMLVGFGGIYLTLFGWSESASGDSVSKLVPISKGKDSQGSGRVFIVCFFGVFFALGAFFLTMMLREAWDSIQSSNWTQLSCKVISSNLRRNESDDGTSYSVDVLYEYEFGGRTIRSNKYKGLALSSGGYTSNKAIVDSYIPGDYTPCYVNPADPTYAVLRPGADWNLLFLLVPGMFVAVGLGGMYFGLKATGSRSPGTEFNSTPRTGGNTWPSSFGTARQSGAYSSASGSSGPVELKPDSSPRGRFFGLFFFSVVWNGITSIGVWHAIQGFLRGSPEVFLGIFMLPFVAIGLVMIYSSVYAFFGLFTPRPKLILSTAVVPLGSGATVNWEIAGNNGRIRSLKLSLVGSEEARYTRGTSTYTDRHEFYCDEFLSLNTLHGQRQGSGSFALPADTMHSFHASDNKILWKIRIEGEIPLAPNLKEEFEIQVSPAPRSER